MAPIALLTTGGTIAIDETVLVGADRMRALLGDAHTDVIEEEVVRVPSSAIGWAEQRRLIARVRALAAAPDPPRGIVITHGTDSLEESGFALLLTIPRTIPIALTGAMIPPGNEHSDAVTNLRDAAAFANDPACAALGPCTVMNGVAHAAIDATKRHTLATTAFESPNLGPVARCNDGAWSIVRTPTETPTIVSETSEAFPDSLPESLADVRLVTLHTATTPAVLHAAASGADALIVEVFGAGNIPSRLDAELARIAGTIPVICCGRTRAGPIELRRNRLDSGVLDAGALHAFKARLLAALALSLDLNLTAIVDNFARAPLPGSQPGAGPP